jgi:hypothetical protein
VQVEQARRSRSTQQHQGADKHQAAVAAGKQEGKRTRVADLIGWMKRVVHAAPTIRMIGGFPRDRPTFVRAGNLNAIIV